MRILITGAGGQLGAALSARLGAADPPTTETEDSSEDSIDRETLVDFPVELDALTSAEFDITDRAAVARYVDEHRPDVIVNTAAYTAVDRAEEDRDAAFSVNETGVAHLAEAADGVDATLIHLSTDYVFDGTKDGWYTEADEPAPLSVYGHSKLAGELRALEAQRAVVLRSSWLLGASETSFVTKILRRAAEHGELRVVEDQIGCPTVVGDLADGIVRLIARLDDENKPGGLYHFASDESATWHQLATAVLDSSRTIGDVPCLPIASSEFETAAERPANSRLDSSLIADELGLTIPSWRIAIPAIVEECERTWLTS